MPQLQVAPLGQALEKVEQNVHGGGLSLGGGCRAREAGGVQGHTAARVPHPCVPRASQHLLGGDGNPATIPERNSPVQ